MLSEIAGIQGYLRSNGIVGRVESSRPDDWLSMMVLCGPVKVQNVGSRRLDPTYEDGVLIPGQLHAKPSAWHPCRHL